MELRPEVGTMSRDGRLRRRMLPGLGLDEQRHVYYYALLPNLLLSLHPDYVMSHTLRPLACNRTEIVCEWHFHPDAIARPDFDPKGAIDFWELTNRQDWDLSELAQQGIGSRGYQPGPYSNREELLHALDRFVLDRVGARE
jgi:Rieske 2Fe-2S family protein